MLFPYKFTQITNPDRLTMEIRNCSGITKAFDHVETSLNPVLTNVLFREELPQGQVSILNNLLMAHDSAPTIEVQQPLEINTKKTSDGIQKVSIYEPEGSSATIVTHNFADRCSWYSYSRPHSEVLQNIGEGESSNKVFKGQYKYWIDLEHGRLYDEDNVMLQTGKKYRPKIYVNNVLQTSGYTINYEDGTVTFEVAQVSTVKVDYYYSDKSYFALRPNPGKKLSIKATEVQFGVNTKLNTPFMFEVWTTGPVPFPIPGTQIVYKNAMDFISACNEGQGFIPKWGEMVEDVIVFPFNYARPKPMKASQGVEIRVYCKEHKAVSGFFATSTFYVTIDDETTT